MMKKLLLLLLFIICSEAYGATAADSTFVFETKSLEPYAAGYLSNGTFSLVTTKLGITNAESYMIWVYDHGPDDIPRICLIPAWNGIDITSGNVRLSSVIPSDNTIHAYTQQLNMYDGTLNTAYQWVNADKVIDVATQAFV